ncbi:MAG: molybdate ABC transporter substrate-binding protein [Ilumatobacteraceae bacterium]
MRRTPRLAIAAVALLGFLGACGSDKDTKTTTTTVAAATTTAGSTTAAPTTAAGTSTTKAATTTSKAPTSTPASTPAAEGDITVFAAASLTASFNEIGSAFSTEYPDAKVTFSFDASSALVTQINEGAPADAFASADEANMKKLTDVGGNAGEPVIFATNVLQIIVPKGNPKGITSVADLAKPGITFVTAAPEVPIGKYTQQVLDAAGVSVTPVSLEQNVKGIVTKVANGEADAGIVYKTDVLAEPKSEGVDIPEDINVIAKYPIVVTKEATNASTGQAFVDFVLSDQGQKILASYGFEAP